MKYIAYVVYVLLSQSLFLKAQKSFLFPEINTTWTTDLQTQGQWETYHEYLFYKTSGDTIINGLLYTIIDSDVYPNYCFLREEDEIVYCKYSGGEYSTDEFVLYNFGYQSGETVQLPMAGNPIQYYEGIVNFVDSILIGQDYHKRISISSWINFDFVEGVGSLQGLLYPEIPWVDWWADLSCFSHNDTVYSLTGDAQTFPGNCWQTIDIIENKSNDLVVFPNPTNGVIKIVGQNFMKAELYDFKGQKIKEAFVPLLNLEDTKKGLYLLQVYSFDHSTNKIKILKTN